MSSRLKLLQSLSGRLCSGRNWLLACVLSWAVVSLLGTCSFINYPWDLGFGLEIYAPIINHVIAVINRSTRADLFIFQINPGGCFYINISTIPCFWVREMSANGAPQNRPRWQCDLLLKLLLTSSFSKYCRV